MTRSVRLKKKHQTSRFAEHVLSMGQHSKNQKCTSDQFEVTHPQKTENSENPVLATPRWILPK